MEMTQAIEALTALAQRSRLAIFRALIEAEPDGLAAGLIAQKLDLPPATLSFHLSQLVQTGLIRSQQEGRFIIYSTSFDSMDTLIAYLTENCCSGRTCGPSPARQHRTTAKA